MSRPMERRGPDRARLTIRSGHERPSCGPGTDTQGTPEAGERAEASGTVRGPPGAHGSVRLVTPSRPDAETLLHFWVAPALGTWAPGATLRGLEESTVPDGATTADLPPPPPRVERNVDTVDLSLGPTIGKGGMGVVRLATQRSLDREVAVKVVSSDRPASVRALVREARVAGRLEHPSIVPVHALCWTDEGPVLVMKRIDGASWRELIANPHHPLWAGREGEPLEWHLEVLQEVCHALELAHSRGVLHRDIKP